MQRKIFKPPRARDCVIVYADADSSTPGPWYKDSKLFREAKTQSRFMLQGNADLRGEAFNLIPPRSVDYPLVYITIHNTVYKAYVDNDAHFCTASPALYRKLQYYDVGFYETNKNIYLPGGKIVDKVLTTADPKAVDLVLAQRSFSVPFIVVPGANTEVVLGSDLLIRAGFVESTYNSSWYFRDEPNTYYLFEPPD